MNHEFEQCLRNYLLLFPAAARRRLLNWIDEAVAKHSSLQNLIRESRSDDPLQAISVEHDRLLIGCLVSALKEPTPRGFERLLAFSRALYGERKELK